MAKRSSAAAELRAPLAVRSLPACMAPVSHRRTDGVLGSGRLATCGRRVSQSSGRHRVELNSIDERVLVDRPGVRGALAQRLTVGLASLSDVLAGDRRERDKLDGVDLNLTGPYPVAAALLDPWPCPQPDRERDVSGQDIVAQLAAELHFRDANW